MTALIAVACFVPAHRVTIEEVAQPFGLTPMQVKVFRRYHKLGEACRDPDGSLADLLRGALVNLTELRGREKSVRYVLYPRTFPVVAPFGQDVIGDVCRQYGLAHAQAFAVSHQACASGLLAIEIAGRLVASDPDPSALALILAGEKTFTPEASLVPETSMFGEGGSACLVGRGGGSDRMLSYAAMLRGEFDGALAEVAGEFQKAYPESLADAIDAALAHAGLTIDDLALILPHNVNAIAWQHVCRRLGIKMDRVLLDNVATYGHVFCADAFINYRHAVDHGRLKPGDRFVMAAAGAGRGATFSAMLFEHQ